MGAPVTDQRPAWASWPERPADAPAWTIGVEEEVMLVAAPDAETACRSLLDDALEAGGRDNVTIVVGRVTAG